MTLKHTAPFLRLLLPFSIGIYAGLQLRNGVSSPPACLSLLCCVLIIVVCLISLRRLNGGARVPTAFIHLLLLFGGVLTALSRYAPAYSDHYTRFNAPSAFLLRITDIPREGKGFIRC
ncbi:MAG: hypothetical protein KJS92_04675, partial [Bacteroidetes bacterium]|nr:hypothetical protein [Bacteroidota bacterium]